MPEYLAPGVYVEEVDSGSKPIEGVSTSTAGMVGVTERGPLDVPILITGMGEFRRWFGGMLNALDFPDGHNYLPYAVDGFFTNGGKRLWITRVLDRELARNAEVMLFDRGDPAITGTVLLRPAVEGSGTSINPPLLVVLDGTNVTKNSFIRVGDGSASEYGQVVADPAAETVLIPLALPLSRSHAGTSPITVDEFAPPPVKLLTLAADASPGDQFVVLTASVAADITALSQTDVFVNLTGGVGELRFVRQVIPSSPTQARIELDSPLLFAHPSSEVVASTSLVAPLTTANLDPDARAGAALMFVDDRHGAFNTRGNYVVIDRGDADTREIRRIGELDVATVAPPAAVAYPVGSLVEPLTTSDAGTHVNPGVLANVDNFVVDDVSTFALGQRVVAGVGAEQETLTLTAIDLATRTLKVTPLKLTAPKTAGAPVVPLRRLTADARAGAGFIALDNRLGLNVGDIVRIGAAPNDEYGIIAALPSRAAAGVRPDAGNVVLEMPLVLDHPQATTDVVQLTAPTVVSSLPTTVLAIAATAGDPALLLADGNGYDPAPDTLMRVSWSGKTVYHRVAAPKVAAAPEMVEIDHALLRAHAAGSPVVERHPLLDVQALDPGAWGDRLRVSIEDEAPGIVARTTLVTFASPTHITLGSPAGVEPGTILEFMLPDSDDVVGALQKVVSVNRSTGEVLLAGGGLDVDQQNAQAAAKLKGELLGVRSREFRLTVFYFRQPDPLVPSRNETILNTEVFRNLSMDVRHSRYAPQVIGRVDGPLRLSDRRPEGESWYIRVADTATAEADLESIRPGPEALIDALPGGRSQPARHALEGGDDSIATVTDANYIGDDSAVPEQRTGLHSLRSIDAIAIVAIPGRTGVALQAALIDHCEFMRYRFAVLDSPVPPDDTLADVQNLRQQYDSKRAAIYYPWLTIPDPFPQTTAPAPDLPIPASGHVVGIYARTDIERGVHKAPANELVLGGGGLNRIVTREEQDVLNPYPVNINVIRDFRPDNRGIRVYGARTISSDTDFKYVNVERLLIFIEHSLDQGLQWVVFEPNAEPLWARVRRSISNFLTLVWRNGALEGTKAEEAYFVKCDRTTMTQTDIDSGRLIVQVGVAPVKPAEFVIVRIGLYTFRADN
jgi:phage tail sheath protein FI